MLRKNKIAKAKPAKGTHELQKLKLRKMNKKVIKTIR